MKFKLQIWNEFTKKKLSTTGDFTQYIDPEYSYCQFETLIQKLASKEELRPPPRLMYDDPKRKEYCCMVGKFKVMIKTSKWAKLYEVPKPEDFKYQRMSWDEIQTTCVVGDILTVYFFGNIEPNLKIQEIYPSGLKVKNRLGYEFTIQPKDVLRVDNQTEKYLKMGKTLVRE